ncbi:MAG TPA: hypothetical protein VN019_05600, partial [Oxalicibacterium sp.]|nr:hypothetical protein [Oxalicibacterium sp.]
MFMAICLPKYNLPPHKIGHFVGKKPLLSAKLEVSPCEMALAVVFPIRERFTTRSALGNPSANFIWQILFGNLYTAVRSQNFLHIFCEGTAMRVDIYRRAEHA